MTGWLPVALFLVGAAGPPGARVAVLEVRAPPTQAGMAAELTSDLVQTAAQAGLRPLTPDAVRASVGDARYEEARACGRNSGCVAQALSALPGQGISRAVAGALDRDEANYRVRLWLLALDTGAVVAQLNRTIPIAGHRFREELDQALPGLLLGRGDQPGMLQVSTSPSGAQLSIDGEAYGQTPASAMIAPGEHAIGLEKTGFLAIHRQVSVGPGAVTNVSIALLGSPEPPPSQPGAMVTRVEQPGRLELGPVAWVSFGVGVAALGTGIGFGLAEKHLEDQVSASYNRQTGVYGARRIDAVRAVRDAGYANGCYLLAGVAAAVGLSAQGVF